MIVIVEWTIFQRFMNQNAIYVKEYDDRWCLYTYDGLMHVKCIVLKSENSEENVMFVERYLNQGNIIRVLDVLEDNRKEDSYVPEEEKESGMLSETSIREEDTKEEIEEVEEGEEPEEIEEPTE